MKIIPKFANEPQVSGMDMGLSEMGEQSSEDNHCQEVLWEQHQVTKF